MALDHYFCHFQTGSHGGVPPLACPALCPSHVRSGAHWGRHSPCPTQSDPRLVFKTDTQAPTRQLTGAIQSPM